MTLLLLVCMLLSLTTSGLAADHISMEKRGKESDRPYTFGDLAAARLSVYGWLDEKYRTPQPETAEAVPRLEAVRLLWNAFDTDEISLCSVRHFSDVTAEYEEPVTWAVEHGIASGITETEFGVYPASETAFVTMLLHALGYQGAFDRAHALDFAETIGLAPTGLSRYFTLGDAALYLQNAMDIQTAGGIAARERMNIPADKNQTTFPDCMILTPLNLEDAEAQIQEATRYLASTITVRGDYLGKDAMLTLYRRCYSAGRAPWYISRTDMEYGLLADMELMETPETTPEQHERFNIFQRGLQEQYEKGTLSSQEYWDALNMKRAELFASGKSLLLTTRYNEAWELACDLDDAFTLYEDDSITAQADRFYQRFFKRAKTDREKVKAAQFAVTYKGDYAPAEGYSEEGPFYAPEAHSIEGFFRNGRVVCEGYASVFQYLMIRSGMECVMVAGSTESREAAEQEQTDHCWNKVLVDGTWLNIDTCWSDTGCPDTYYLKTDVFYENHRHWAVTYRDL